MRGKDHKVTVRKMPFHPSNTYTIDELNANLMDILDDCEKRAEVSFDGKVKLDVKHQAIHAKQR